MRREGGAFAPEVVRLFTRYTWPGNVRDIQNEVERAVALASDGETIGVSSLSDELVAFERSGVPPRADGEGTLAHMVEGLEERAIRDALLRFAGNKSRAARSLGLTRKGLRNKILRYGIDS
jgi:two-component system response regulator HupR/HoxA